MFVLIIQTILLLAIAFILGCIIGCLLRRLFGSAEVDTPAVATGTAALGAGAAASVAMKKPPVPEAPVLETPAVPKPPVPSAPPSAPKPAPVATPRPVTPPPMPKPPKLEPAKPVPAPEASKPVEKPKPEPVQAEATPVAPLVSKPAPKPATPKPAVQTKDNLKLIRGIGPQNEGRLNALGVFRFEQIAKWTSKDESHFGDVLAFPGRIEREGWVEQAKVLSMGGTTEFAGRVKSGDVESSQGKADAGEMGTKPKTLSAARGGKADNLTLIDGVGNAIEQKMFKLGVYHFDQISAMSPNELIWLGNAVGFPGRPERENWAGESKILAAGGTTDHAKRVERGEIKTSRKTDED